MRLHKTSVAFASIVALTGWLLSAGIAKSIAQANALPARAAARAETPGFSGVGKAALSGELGNAVMRGDTPGVVALVIGPDSVLYEGAAGKLDDAGERYFFDRVDDQTGDIGGHHDAF